MLNWIVVSSSHKSADDAAHISLPTMTYDVDVYADGSTYLKQPATNFAQINPPRSALDDGGEVWPAGDIRFGHSKSGSADDEGISAPMSLEDGDAKHGAKYF
jgi:hypothetical protein